MELFKSIHNNRKQYTKHFTQKSETKNILNGVPQGSMLSASEFTIYINDLFNININGKIQMYADDTVVMLASSNITELIHNMQNDIDQINNWLQVNKLKINIKKPTI